MKEKNDGFLKLVMKFSIATWLNFVVGLVSSSVGTRIVPPELFGLYNEFNSTVTLVMYLCILGMDSSLMRFFFEVPNGEDKRVFLCKLALIALGITTVATVVCSLLYRIVSQRLFGTESLSLVLLLFACVAANVILRFLNIVYRMNGDAKKYTIQNVLLQTTMRLSIIVAVLIRPTFESIVLVEASGLVLLTLVYLRLQRKNLLPAPEYWRSRKVLSYNGYWPCFRFGFFSAPAYIIITLNTFLAQQLIRIKISAYALGVYSSASYFVTLLNVVNGGFSTFWAGYLYANYENEKKKIVQIQDYLLLILSICFIGILLFKDLIYLILIGTEYHASKSIVAFVLIPAFLEILGQTSYCGINIHKKNQILMYTCLLMAVLNVCLLWVLIPVYGMFGAALSGTLASVTAFSINTWFGQRLYRTIDRLPRFLISIGNIVFLAFANTFVNNSWKMSLLLLIDLTGILLIYRSRLAEMLNWIQEILKNKKGKVRK